MLKSKSFWTGILTVCGGIAVILNGDSETGFQTIAIGLSTIFLRHAVEKK
jgi:hypothetical protein